MADLKHEVVVITGGAGFIGSHTVEVLAQEAHKVLVYDNRIVNNNLAVAAGLGNVEVVEGDILDRPLLKEVIGGAGMVVHLGGLLLSEAEKEPDRALDINLRGTLNVLEASSKAKVRKVLYASSISIYGTQPTGTEDAPYDCNSLYGMTKAAGEQMCRYYYATRGLKYIVLRYSSVYGPRQHSYGLYPSVIHRAILDMAEGRTPVINGTGEAKQDFVFVRDVARANMLAARSELHGDCLNIASGQSFSLRECLDILFDLFQAKERKVEFRAGAKSFFGDRRFSYQKASQAIGYAPETSLREGLRQLKEWALVGKEGSDP